MLKKRIKTKFLVVLAACLIFFPVAAWAGSVVNLSDTSISFTEGDAAVYVDTAATVSSATPFDDGYVRFSVGSANSEDVLMLTSNANPNANGAISVSGGTVYLGDGSGDYSHRRGGQHRERPKRQRAQDQLQFPDGQLGL